MYGSKSVVYLHNGIVGSREKEGAYTLCNSMNGTFHILLISSLYSFLSGYLSEVIWKLTHLPLPFPGSDHSQHLWRIFPLRRKGMCPTFPLLIFDFFLFRPQRTLQENRDVPSFHPLNIHQVIDPTSIISQGNKNSLQPALCYSWSSQPL